MNGMKTRPFSNKPFWIDSETGQTFHSKKDIPDDAPKLDYWDSVLEYRVYQELLSVIPAEQISRQVIIPILCKNPPFPQWNWCVDFVLHLGKISIIVEAKGKWILGKDEHCKSFIQTLRMFKVEYPELFNNLIIVGDSRWTLPGTMIWVTDIKDLLREVDMIKSRGQP
jgi:hypothetical protein